MASMIEGLSFNSYVNLINSNVNANIQMYLLAVVLDSEILATAEMTNAGV